MPQQELNLFELTQQLKARKASAARVPPVGDVCLKGHSMKKKDPAGYPGDEDVKKAVGEALRQIRVGKGISLEEAEAIYRKANQEDSQSKQVLAKHTKSNLV